MNGLDFYLGDPLTKVPEPDNWQDLLIELSFENNSPDSGINTTKLIWKGSNAVILNQWFQGGISASTLGVFGSVPLRIQLRDTNVVIFNGIIDLTDKDTKWNCDIVQTKIRDFKIELITDLLDSISYAYLATPKSQGGAAFIHPSPKSEGGDYVTIPYQVVNIPDYIEFMITALSVYEIITLGAKLVNDLEALITGGLSAAAGAGIGALILASVQFVAELAGIIILSAMLLEMLKMMADYIISPVFTKFGMYAFDLISKACNFFGIKFQSSIIGKAVGDVTTPFSNMVIMPSKQAWINNKSVARQIFSGLSSTVGSGNGYTTNKRMVFDDFYNWQYNQNNNQNNLEGLGAYGYFDGSPGELIRGLEQMFNAKAKVLTDQSGVITLFLERWDYFYNESSLTLPPISDAPPFPQAFGTNAADVPANYQVIYAEDSSDTNTIMFWDGNNCVAQTTLTNIPANQLQNPNTVFGDLKSNNSRNISTLHGYIERDIPFSHAKRKTELTAPESILVEIGNDAVFLPNKLIGSINSTINSFNSIKILPKKWHLDTIPTLVNPFSNIANTIGIMQLSDNITGEPKVFLSGGDIELHERIFSIKEFNSYRIKGVKISELSNPDSSITGYSDIPNLSAQSLMKFFHFSSLGISQQPPDYAGISYSSPQHTQGTYYNQYKQYYDQEIPMTGTDFLLVYNNNIITTFDGSKGRVYSLKWNPFKGKSQMDYGVHFKYAGNLQTTYIIDGQATTKEL